MGTSRARILNNGSLTVQKWSKTLAAAGTTLEVTGLDLSAYDTFFIVAELKNNGAVDGSVSMYFGTAGGAADTTATNYDRVIITGNGATVPSSRANDGFVGSLRASTTLSLRGELTREIDGKPVFTWRTREYVTTLLEMRTGTTMWRTGSNPSSIMLSCAVSMAAGSRITVYAFTGNKTAEGNANPSFASDGDRFFRKDLGWEIFYKASINKWLTVQEFTVPWLWTGASMPISVTNGCVGRGVTCSNVYLPYFTRGTVRHETTSAAWTATNYWRTTFVCATGGSYNVDIQTGSSQPGEVAINALGSVAENVLWLPTKVGAPSSMYAYAALSYRLVIP